MNYIYKSLLQFCLWREIPLKLLKVYIINVQDCTTTSVTEQKFNNFISQYPSLSLSQCCYSNDVYEINSNLVRSP